MNVLARLAPGFALLWAAASFAACGGARLTGHAQPVIYGIDDRTEYHAEPDEGVRALLRESTVMLVASDQLDEGDPENVRVLADSLRDSYGTCASERFNSQPAAGLCSGTLIDHDLVLTAGHCTEAARCSRARWVFNFFYETEGQLATITADDVYRCSAVVVRRLEDPGALSFDHAIIRLDRSATPRHRPVPVAPVGTLVSFGDPLVHLGYPLGIPGKTMRGNALDGRPDERDLFLYVVDAYEGSSGGAVYDGMLRLVGIEARGSDDFVTRGNCDVSAVLPDDGFEGVEEASYAWNAVATLCERPEYAASFACTGDVGALPDAGAPASTDGGVIPDGGATVRHPSSGCGAAGGGASAFGAACLAALLLLAGCGRCGGGRPLPDASVPTPDTVKPLVPKPSSPSDAGISSLLPPSDIPLLPLTEDDKEEIKDDEEEEREAQKAEESVARDEDRLDREGDAQEDQELREREREDEREDREDAKEDELDAKDG